MTRKKIGKIVVEDLRNRSKKSLEVAKKILLEEKIEHQKLHEALLHYTANWDEFTHPGLFSMAYEAVGGEYEGGLNVQVAITMFTAAFDIHDDIIDKSKEKHQIPTVYGKFGNEIALLLGNAFMIEGFKVFGVAVNKTLPLDKQKEAFEVLQKLLFEVGNAHALELGLKRSKNISPSEYLKITELKAASLEADMYFGALFGGANETDLMILSRIGRILGILATLRDDIIDVFDIEELRQRIVSHDLPLPLIFAMQDQKIKKKAMAIISKPRLTKTAVAEIVDLTIESEPVAELKNRMKLLIEEGLNRSSKLSKRNLSNEVQILLKFMLEDL